MYELIEIIFVITIPTRCFPHNVGKQFVSEHCLLIEQHFSVQSPPVYGTCGVIIAWLLKWAGSER